jgi:hypothetical protein
MSAFMLDRIRSIFLLRLFEKKGPERHSLYSRDSLKIYRRLYRQIRSGLGAHLRLPRRCGSTSSRGIQSAFVHQLSQPGDTFLPLRYRLAAGHRPSVFIFMGFLNVGKSNFDLSLGEHSVYGEELVFVSLDELVQG